MANNILAKMAVQISANTAEFNKALQKTNKDINTFTSDLKGVAGAVGIAFGVQQLLQFTFEASKLAGVFEGVKNAFDKLEGSERLLKDLTRATSGAVSELDLMKRAVQFSNFGLELSKLPSLLEFATKRAQATGQSVDYLVDSIVTGLGRKSVLILDNLGISATMLKEELAKVGDITVAVSNIIERDVANSGDVVETAAIKAERLTVAIDDLKIAFGNLANSSGFSTSVKILTDFIDILSGKQSGSNNALYLPWGQVIKLSEEATSNLKPALGEIQKGFREAMKAGFNLVKPIETINSLTAELKLLEEQRGELSGQALIDTNREIDVIHNKIKALRELGVAVQQSVPNRNAVSTDPINTGNLSGAQLFPVIPDLKVSFDNAVGYLNQFKEEYKEFADNTIEISGLIVGGIVDIADAFGQAAVSGGDQFGKAILSSLGAFAQQFGAILIAAGVAKISFDKFSGPGMIAAGAALVALGGAVRATISNRPNLSSGGGGVAINRGNGFGPQNTVISGDFRIDGRDLVFVYDKNKSLDGRRK